MKRNNLSKQLKDAVENSGKSLITVAAESGVPQSTLYRFCNEYRENSLSISNVQKLMDYFGFTIIVSSNTQ